MIIRTILDTDLYKFTTSYAYIKLFPYAIGTFSFKDRDGTEYSDEFVERLRTEISQLSHVALTEKELEYMIKNCRFLPRVYWEWLSSFRFQPEKIEIRLDENRQLHIEVNDYLYKATLYEVPLLAIVSEIKNQSSGNVANLEDILYKLSEKTELSNKHQLLFSRNPKALFVRCAESSHRAPETDSPLLYRHFQLPFRHEIRHEAHGYASP